MQHVFVVNLVRADRKSYLHPQFLCRYYSAVMLLAHRLTWTITHDGVQRLARRSKKSVATPNDEDDDEARKSSRRRATGN